MKFSNITKDSGGYFPFCFFEESHFSATLYFYSIDDFFKEYANAKGIKSHGIDNLKQLLLYYREKIHHRNKGDSLVIPLLFDDEGISCILVKLLDNQVVCISMVFTKVEDYPKWGCMSPSLFYLENIGPTRKILVLAPEDVFEVSPKHEMSKMEFITAYDGLIASIV